MSRTNPYKKKRRSANKTILVYSEGLSEEIFLKYLRGLYSRDRDVAITIRRGKGGTADGLVIQANKTQGAFDRRIVVLDNDKSKSEMQKAKQESEKRKIELFEHTPCLESVLLSILRKGQSFKHKSSSWCKQEFESKYIDRKKRDEVDEYIKVFPKSLLDKQSSKVKELKMLISLVLGK
ncbi:MAG: hypothetical protein Q8O88_00335 [bacterium]|nr:hypothetical protein [bacterium]